MSIPNELFLILNKPFLKAQFYDDVQYIGVFSDKTYFKVNYNI